MDGTKIPEMPETPEIEKMEVAKATHGTEHIGAFLEWCSDRGWTLEDRDQYAVRGSIEEKLALYTGIDLQQVDAEKRALLNHVCAHGLANELTPTPDCRRCGGTREVEYKVSFRERGRGPCPGCRADPDAPRPSARDVLIDLAEVVASSRHDPYVVIPAVNAALEALPGTEELRALKEVNLQLVRALRKAGDDIGECYQQAGRLLIDPPDAAPGDARQLLDALGVDIGFRIDAAIEAATRESTG